MAFLTVRAVALAVLGWAAFALPASAQSLKDEVSGIGSVQSGGTLLVGRTIVQLYGLVAPEKDDRCELAGVAMQCGIVAWAELIKLADGHHVSCDVNAPGETPDSVFGTCYVDEHDLNEAMVRAGWAKANVEQAETYLVDEADARDSGRGLWITLPPETQ